MTPDLPKGSTTDLIISQRVAPSASAASSCRRGVCRKISRDTAVMIGRIMTARTTEAEARFFIGAVGSPAKSGMKPRFLLRNMYSGSRRGTSQTPPQRPKTTEGTAASRSIR